MARLQNNSHIGPNLVITSSNTFTHNLMALFANDHKRGRSAAY